VSSEEIWYKLNNIAFKLYHLNLEFNQLTSEELQFWKKFKQEDIFEPNSSAGLHQIHLNSLYIPRRQPSTTASTASATATSATDTKSVKTRQAAWFKEQTQGSTNMGGALLV
jgi:hypothetical protein